MKIPRTVFGSHGGLMVAAFACLIALLGASWVAAAANTSSTPAPAAVTQVAATMKQAPATMAPAAQYMMDRDAEIALARSAAPKMISDDATILVLGKAGYETAVKGSNGFTCFVGRSWMNDFGTVDFWDPMDRTPNCVNAAAEKSVMPEFLERTQWVMAGVSQDEMAARTKAAWSSHKYTLPAAGTVDYMMSKQQCIHPPAPCNWYPHVMFFEATADGQKWGDNLKGVPAFSGVSTTDPVTTFMVLVPKWSDGTLSPADIPAEHKH